MSLANIDAVVMFSGGLGSFLAAALYKQQNPGQDILLYFNDTKTEDEDLYRFLHEGRDWLGLPLVEDSDGRNIWEFFKDRGFGGNNRVPVCSIGLKIERRKKWMAENAPDATIVLGIDWTEIHRLEANQQLSSQPVAAPLCEDLRTKQEIYESLDNPPKLPRLYSYGFPHNNCGGGCVRAGLAQWQLLLDKFPERYAWRENQQNQLMASNPKIKPFLTKTVKGKEIYITLTEFREVWAHPGMQIELDFGGCGCALEIN
jgi:hypothetical protein